MLFLLSFLHWVIGCGIAVSISIWLELNIGVASGDGLQYGMLTEMYQQDRGIYVWFC